MSYLSQSNVNQSNTLYQTQTNNAPKKLQKSQYYRYSENYYKRSMGSLNSLNKLNSLFIFFNYREAENQTQKSDFQEKMTKTKSLRKNPFIINNYFSKEHH